MSTLDLVTPPLGASATDTAPNAAAIEAPVARGPRVLHRSRLPRRIPLRWQLLGGFGIVLVVLSLAGFWTAHVMNLTDDAYSALVDGSATEGLVAEQMRAELLTQAEAAKDVFLRGGDPDSFAKYAARFDASTVTLRELRARMDALPHLSADERALLQQFDTNWAGYVDAWPKAKAAYAAGKVQDADTIMRGHYPAAASALDQLAVKVESRSRTEGARLAANTDEVTGVVLPLLGFVTLLGVAVALLITRTVTREVGGAAGALLDASTELAATTAQQRAGAAAQAGKLDETTAAVATLTDASALIARHAQAICRAADDEAKAASRDLGDVRVALDQLVGGAGTIHVLEQSVPLLTAQCEELEHLLVRLDQRTGEQGALLLGLLARGTDAYAGARTPGSAALDTAALAEQAAAVAAQVRPLLAEVRRVLPGASRGAAVAETSLAAAADRIDRTAAALRGDLDAAVGAARTIVSTTADHAAAARQLAAAMGSIDRTARENAVAAQRAQDAARRLGVLAGRLDALITGRRAVRPAGDGSRAR